MSDKDLEEYNEKRDKHRAERTSGFDAPVNDAVVASRMSAVLGQQQEHKQQQQQEQRPNGQQQQPPMVNLPPAPMPITSTSNFVQQQQMTMNMVPGMPSSSGPARSMQQQQQQQLTRHARRIYVGGLPETATNANIQSFFSMALEAVDGAGEGLQGDPVVNVYVNMEKKFAFVEYRTGAKECLLVRICGYIYIYIYTFFFKYITTRRRIFTRIP